MDNLDRRVLLGAAGLVGIAALGSRGQGGPLNPPGGAVSSTGKPLTDVEPRVAINATNTPGDVDSLFRITQSGSYYLTGNVQGVANKHGIKVTADNVTIDLNGFTMLGVVNSRDAVRGDGGTSFSGLTVRNGRIRSWSNGSGVFAAGMSECVIENVSFEFMAFEGVWLGARARVIGCWTLSTRNGLRAGVDSLFDRCRVQLTSENGVLGGTGCTVWMCEVVGAATASILLGDRSRVEGCVVSGGSSTGVQAGSSSRVVGCVVTGGTSAGVQVGAYSRVEGCESRQVNGVGISCAGQCVVSGCAVWDAASIGIQVQAEGVVEGCRVHNAGDVGVRCFAGGTVRETEVFSCTSWGINCDSNCTVRGCKCSANGGGIRADGGALVVGCVCQGSVLGSAPGISIFGARGRVEGNQCVGNQIGIATSASTLVIGNTSGGNLVTNWSLAAGTVYGPIIDKTSPGTPAGTGNSAADASGTTHPWANFTH